MFAPSHQSKFAYDSPFRAQEKQRTPHPFLRENAEPGSAADHRRHRTRLSLIAALGMLLL